MKNKWYILFVILCIVGCKSYTPSMSIPKNNPVASKLGNVDIILPSSDSYWKSDRQKKDIIYNYIRQDLRKNFCNAGRYGTSGKISITSKAYDGDYGDVNTYVAMHLFVPLFTFGTIYPLSILGLPCSSAGLHTILQFDVSDREGTPLKRYTYEYKNESVNGIYYGRSGKRHAIDGAKSIMAQFRDDYERDFQSVFARMQNPLTEKELANMEPAYVNIIFPEENTDFYNENARRKADELFYIEINGKNIGTIRYGEYTKVILPQGSYKIHIYPNSYYSENGITYYEDLSLAKAAHKGTLEIDEILYSSDRINLCINKLSKGNYDVKKQDLSKLQYEYLSRGRNYDFRNKAQSPLAVQRISPITKQAPPEQYIQSTREAKNNQNEQKQTPTVQQAVLSDVDKDIPLASSLSSDMYVLIIANEDYEYLDDVNYASKDGKIFKEYCLQTLGVPVKQIFYYENATVGKISDGVGKLKYCLDNFEGAKAIVYYCGHGIPDEKTGQAYLIPTDGKATNTSICYSLDKLYKTLAATKAQSITYFMDACFTGANKEGSMLVAARGVARAPEKETLSGKTIVFSASSGDETAMTLNEEGHGLFTYYLLKKLQETNGDVTYGELADYINRNVKKDAFLINEKPQTPVVATSPAVQNIWKTMKLK